MSELAVIGLVAFVLFLGVLLVTYAVVTIAARILGIDLDRVELP